MFLYVKTHSTGLKYLGKTVFDPFTYKGSGTHWLRHLNKHGEEHTTEILLETDDKELLKQKAIYYSELYDVVKSKQWANIVPEQGDGGDTSMSPAYKDYIKNRDMSGEKNSFYGKKHTEETKRKISEARKGKGTGPKSAETRKKMSENNRRYWAGKEPWNKGKKGLQKQGAEQLAKKSTPVVYKGTRYPSLNEASRQTGLSTYKIKLVL